MLTSIANIHHSKLPAAGEIVRISDQLRRRTYFPALRWIVESFNLCDSADARYSHGIHLVNLRSLCGRYTRTISGFWCCDDLSGDPI